jgi:hypothetical protein
MVSSSPNSGIASILLRPPLSLPLPMPTPPLLAPTAIFDDDDDDEHTDDDDVEMEVAATTEDSDEVGNGTVHCVTTMTPHWSKCASDDSQSFESIRPRLANTAAVVCRRVRFKDSSLPRVNEDNIPYRLRFRSTASVDDILPIIAIVTITRYFMDRINK